MAVRGSALGKDGDRVFFLYGFTDNVDLTTNLHSLGPRDENRLIDPAQPSNDWPTGDAILRYKSAAGYPGYHGNIKPAYMIGNIENILLQTITLGLDHCAAIGCHQPKEEPRPWRGQAE